MKNARANPFWLSRKRVRHFRHLFQFDVISKSELAGHLGIQQRKLHYLIKHPQQLSFPQMLAVDHYLKVKEDTTFDLIAVQTEYSLQKYGLRWREEHNKFGYIYRKRKMKRS